jgi:integrase
MPEQLTFSKKTVEAVKPPAKGRLVVHDTKIRGLVMRVTETGARSFFIYRKVDGRPRKYFICSWPDLTVDQIRDKAEQYNADIANGIDPTAERKASREQKTLGEVWEHYLEGYAKPHKRSWKTDEWQWGRFLKGSWSGKLVREIDTSALESLHTKVGKETGKIPANRLRSLLHALFAWAIKQHWHPGPNPVKGVKRYQEHNRERYLGPDELPKLFTALDAEPSEQLADFFRLALFTGARRGNLQSARWDEIDMFAGVWTIPATKAKGKKSITIPLSAEAIDVLRRRLLAADGSPWVFPSHGAKGHITEPKAAWKRICTAAGLENVRLHDLRHTTASWMIARGASLFTVGKALGHADERTAQRYSHLDLSQLRAAMSGATGAMVAKPKAKKAKGVNRGK